MSRFDTSTRTEYVAAFQRRHECGPRLGAHRHPGRCVEPTARDERKPRLECRRNADARPPAAAGAAVAVGRTDAEPVADVGDGGDRARRRQRASSRAGAGGRRRGGASHRDLCHAAAGATAWSRLGATSRPRTGCTSISGGTAWARHLQLVAVVRSSSGEVVTSAYYVRGEAMRRRGQRVDVGTQAPAGAPDRTGRRIAFLPAAALERIAPRHALGARRARRALLALGRRRAASRRPPSRARRWLGDRCRPLARRRAFRDWHQSWEDDTGVLHTVATDDGVIVEVADAVDPAAPVVVRRVRSDVAGLRLVVSCHAGARRRRASRRGVRRPGHRSRRLLPPACGAGDRARRRHRLAAARRSRPPLRRRARRRARARRPRPSRPVRGNRRAGVRGRGAPDRRVRRVARRGAFARAPHAGDARGRGRGRQAPARHARRRPRRRPRRTTVRSTGSTVSTAARCSCSRRSPTAPPAR